MKKKPYQAFGCITAVAFCGLAAVVFVFVFVLVCFDSLSCNFASLSLTSNVVICDFNFTKFYSVAQTLKAHIHTYRHNGVVQQCLDDNKMKWHENWIEFKWNFNGTAAAAEKNAVKNETFIAQFIYFFTRKHKLKCINYEYFRH